MSIVAFYQIIKHINDFNFQCLKLKSLMCTVVSVDCGIDCVFQINTNQSCVEFLLVG